MKKFKVPGFFHRRIFFLPTGPGMTALAAAAFVLGAGCVVTDSIEEDVSGEDMGNFPPKIVDDSASPPNTKTILVDGCSANFSVGLVEDMDLDDSLEARWFVDGAMVAWSNLPPAEGDKLRVGPVFTFEAEDYDRGVHTILLVISDGFAEGRDLKAAASGKSKDSLLWSIDLRGASCGMQVSDAGENSSEGGEGGDV